MTDTSTNEMDDAGAPSGPGSRASTEPQRVSAVPASIPRAIAEQVLAMGPVEWGATAEYTHDGHLAHLGESLRMTREHFNFEDVPVPMHGLYLTGTETVLCHTGTSPNSGANAQALAGAWNWLFEQCAQAIEARSGETGTGSIGEADESAVAESEAPNPSSQGHHP